MAWFQRPQLQETAHREAVLRNLHPLVELCKIRGGDIEFDASWPVEKLEKLLWEIVNGLAKRGRLTFADGTPCEERIMEIRRHMPPMPRRGTSHPFLQNIATAFQ